MIVLDASDLRRNVIAPTSSPIGSLLSGKMEDEVIETMPPPPRLGNSRVEGKGLEQINTKLEKLMVKPKRKLKNIKFTL